jgi:maleate cis-trans isomerase
MYGWRGKIGLLVPSTNIPAEMDAHRLVPEGVSVTTGRVRFAGEVIVETGVQVSRSSRPPQRWSKHSARSACTE